VEPGRHHTYLLANPIFDTKHGSWVFITRGADPPPVNLVTAADFRPPPDDGRGVAIIALENRLADLRAIQARLPGGTERRVTAQNGRTVYYVYRVPPRS
jgi:hypothetical protein